MTGAARLALVAGLVMALAGPAFATTITEYAQGLAFDIDDGTGSPVDDYFNAADWWLDQQNIGGTNYRMSVITDGSGNPQGLALGYNVYFGGLAEFTHLQTPFQQLSQGGLPQVTAKIYGLYLDDVTSSGTVVKGIGGVAQLVNIDFSGWAKGTEKVFTLVLDRETVTAGFELYSDPDIDFAPVDRHADLAGFDFMDGTGGTSADVINATDNPYAKPLLSGEFLRGADDSGSFISEININLRYRTDAEGGGVVVKSVDADNMYWEALAGSELEDRGWVDFFDVFAHDGYLSARAFAAYNPDAVDPYDKLPQVVGAQVGGVGAYYAAPATQSFTHAELEDETELHMKMQQPLPSAVYFMAPSFVGFVAYSVRRRRRSK